MLEALSGEIHMRNMPKNFEAYLYHRRLVVSHRKQSCAKYEDEDTTTHSDYEDLAKDDPKLNAAASD